jgi:hypothetical protein
MPCLILPEDSAQLTVKTGESLTKVSKGANGSNEKASINH